MRTMLFSTTVLLHGIATLPPVDMLSKCQSSVYPSRADRGCRVPACNNHYHYHPIASSTMLGTRWHTGKRDTYDPMHTLCEIVKAVFCNPKPKPSCRQTALTIVYSVCMGSLVTPLPACQCVPSTVWSIDMIVTVILAGGYLCGWPLRMCAHWWQRSDAAQLYHCSSREQPFHADRIMLTVPC